MEILQKEMKISKNFENFDSMEIKNLVFASFSSFNFGIFLFVSGFSKGSVKIFLDFELKKEIDFHDVKNIFQIIIIKILILKKQVNFLKVCYANNLLICGSEDGRITFWDLNEIISSNIKYLFPKFIIYGHSKIICLSLDSILGVVITVGEVKIFKLPYYIC